MIAGVCAGLAEQFGVSVTALRLAAVLLTLIGGWGADRLHRPLGDHALSGRRLRRSDAVIVKGLGDSVSPWLGSWCRGCRVVEFRVEGLSAQADARQLSNSLTLQPENPIALKFPSHVKLSHRATEPSHSLLHGPMFFSASRLLSGRSASPRASEVAPDLGGIGLGVLAQGPADRLAQKEVVDRRVTARCSRRAAADRSRP